MTKSLYRVDRFGRNMGEGLPAVTRLNSLGSRSASQRRHQPPPLPHQMLRSALPYGPPGGQSGPVHPVHAGLDSAGIPHMDKRSFRPAASRYDIRCVTLDHLVQDGAKAAP